jgi:hypothetical protein
LQQISPKSKRLRYPFGPGVYCVQHVAAYVLQKITQLQVPQLQEQPQQPSLSYDE